MQFHLPNHPLQLILVRHGEVEETYHKVFGGSKIDMALSPLGHAQGAAVAQWFGADDIHAVYASPMLRVQQTMAPPPAAKTITPTLLDPLR